MEKIKKIVKEFIIENFLFGNEGELTEATSFLDEGIIDSTGVLELVTFIEEKFAIAIDDDELIPENLDTIGRVAAFILRKNTDVVAA